VGTLCRQQRALIYDELNHNTLCVRSLFNTAIYYSSMSGADISCKIGRTD